MRVLFLGDIVGRAARHAVIEHVPELRAELSLDFIVVNCENAAGGFGVTPAICDELFACGIDVLTTGNHVWDKREIIPYIEANPRLIRPINMAEGTPGSGTVKVTNDAGKRLVVVNAITNLFMNDYDPVFPAVNGALPPLSGASNRDMAISATMPACAASLPAASASSAASAARVRPASFLSAAFSAAGSIIGSDMMVWRGRPTGTGKKEGGDDQNNRR